jgi:iron(II)-dependent oxidoreductase
MQRNTICNVCFLLFAILTFIAGCAKAPKAPSIIGKDGAEMVLIPAGEFQMGDSLDGMSNALPVHTVYLDAFYIDIYEVTNAQYKKFMDATGYKAPTYWNLLDYWNDPNYNAPNNPVVGVSWYDAKAYADWAGKRLPTEAEWEKAARGGLVGKRYPWGDVLTYDDANYNGIGLKDRWTYTSPVGSFAPNGYGLYDMAGNVWEWCADWYDGSYYANSPKSNPKGPDSGSYKVLRGGSWNSDDNLRTAHRSPSDPTGDVRHGFRCGASRSD